MKIDPDAYRIAGLANKRLKHADLWPILEDMARASSSNAELREFGRSGEGRPLKAVTVGTGPVRVFAASQIHGNEPTGTMALADVLNLLINHANTEVAHTILNGVTLTAVPMVNPDGAERFIRQNAMGIDLNRDAQKLSAPESRALLTLYGEVDPEYSFSLHGQEPRKRVAESRAPVAFSICAPMSDPASRSGGAEARERARRILSEIRSEVEPRVNGHLTRYGGEFDPQAFDDNFQSWGTSSLLFEAGWWEGDSEKQYLRSVYTAALIAGLRAIATGAGDSGDTALFDATPPSGEKLLHDVLIRGGNLCVPGHAPYAADLAIDYNWPLERREGRIVCIGDLSGEAGVAEIDASELVLHIDPAILRDNALNLESPARFVARRGASSDSEEVWRMEEGPPSDASVLNIEWIVKPK